MRGPVCPHLPMLDINGIVARNVERYQLQRRMSVSQVARLAGVSKATLLSIELGHANPTLETLQALAAALNVSLGDLIAQSEASVVDVRRADEATWRDLDGLRMRPLATFSGAVLAGPCDALVELKAGDWIRFPTDRPHACRVIGEPAEIVFVAVRRSIPGVSNVSQEKPGRVASAAQHRKPKPKRVRQAD